MPSNEYEYYNELHDCFNEAFHSINQYVIDLYILPKRFIEETGPALDKFIRNQALPGVPSNPELSSRSVMDFIGQVDDFTVNTIRLFDEHRAQVDDCAAYLEKVSRLEQKCRSGKVSDCTLEYVQLTPELVRLNEGLSRIKEKAEDMVNNLERLEAKWGRIKPRIDSG